MTAGATMGAMDDTRGPDDHEDARADAADHAEAARADAAEQPDASGAAPGSSTHPGPERAARREADATAEFREAQRLHRLAGPQRLALRPEARRRALVAGVAAGPFASAGAGFTTLGVSAALSTFGGGGPWFPSTTVFLLVGIASLVVAVLVARRLTRTHHRGGVVALGGLALAGLPFIPAAPTIAANVILSLAVRTGTVSPAPEVLVFATCWGALAVIGLVLGPLAFLLVAHLNRGLTPEAESDPVASEKFARTTRRLD